MPVQLKYVIDAPDLGSSGGNVVCSRGLTMGADVAGVATVPMD